MQQALCIRITRYNALKQWQRRRELFPDVKGNEDSFYPLIYPRHSAVDVQRRVLGQGIFSRVLSACVAIPWASRVRCDGG